MSRAGPPQAANSAPRGAAQQRKLQAWGDHKSGGALARAAGLALVATTLGVTAGPVEVYREGPRFCPRDRAGDAAPLTQDQAIERARSLLPQDFCGPSRFVTGCDVLPELALDSWRIYFQQYRLHAGVHDTGGLNHTYVVLDRVGNCYANIPGTELGAPR